jgi:hypothetical protein
MSDPITGAALGLTALGGAINAAGTIAGGQMQNQAAQYKATQDTINASQTVAAGQRQALDRQWQTRMALSSLRARGAASGLDLTSPSAAGLASSIGSRGAYQAAMDMWQGQNQAAGLLDQAAAERYSGEAAETGAAYSALGTIAGTGASMLKRYGGMS